MSVISVVMLPWAAVARGATVILATGATALVLAAGQSFGSRREVVAAHVDGSPGCGLLVVDTHGQVPVVFSDESKAMAVLSSYFDIQPLPYRER